MPQCRRHDRLLADVSPSSAFAHARVNRAEQLPAVIAIVARRAGAVPSQHGRLVDV
jgi:hypothetical protein